MPDGKIIIDNSKIYYNNNVKPLFPNNSKFIATSTSVRTLAADATLTRYNQTYNIASFPMSDILPTNYLYFFITYSCSLNGTTTTTHGGSVTIRPYIKLTTDMEREFAVMGMEFPYGSTTATYISNENTSYDTIYFNVNNILLSYVNHRDEGYFVNYNDIYNGKFVLDYKYLINSSVDTTNITGSFTLKIYTISTVA